MLVRKCTDDSLGAWSRTVFASPEFQEAWDLGAGRYTWTAEQEAGRPSWCDGTCHATNCVCERPRSL